MSDHTPLHGPEPARTLMEVARTVTLQSLPVGDRRYVYLSAGAGTDDLELLRQKLRDAASGAALDESGSIFLTNGDFQYGVEDLARRAFAVL